MKRTLMAIGVGLLLAAGSAFGVINERPNEFERGSAGKVERFSGGVELRVWAGKRVVHSGVFGVAKDGLRCMAEQFYFADRHPMRATDIDKFLRPYGQGGLVEGKAYNDGQFVIVPIWNVAGQPFAFALYNCTANTLSVLTPALFSQVKRNAQPQQPWPGQKLDQQQQPQDCLIVAVEAYARLRGTATWAKIVSFDWSEGGKIIGGHAVVCFQPTSASNLWMYDRGGSIELPTRSHELGDIQRAINAVVAGTNDAAVGMRWVE